MDVSCAAGCLAVSLVFMFVCVCPAAGFGIPGFAIETIVDRPWAGRAGVGGGVGLLVLGGDPQGGPHHGPLVPRPGYHHNSWHIAQRAENPKQNKELKFQKKCFLLLFSARNC